MDNMYTNSKVLQNSFPMNGGEGPYSYANNSTYQKMGLDVVKTLLYEEISNKLDVKLLLCNSSSNSFNIADLGCSVGPNTFIIAQYIIEAVEFNCQSQGLNFKNIEFQVFFNDHTSNDFNTLFKSLPLERNYFAAGVPGSFHGRLFPKEKLHFVHSSYSVQWLSKVPKEVVDKCSPAWNKGSIGQNGSKDVQKAYSSQFASDVETFLRARAAEIVCGGFIALLLPSIPTGADPSKCWLIQSFEVLHSSLTDLTKKGLVDEAEVDSFNMPIYITSQKELESLIQRNGSFKIERIEELAHPFADSTRLDIEKIAFCMRAGIEGVTREHFGSKITEVMFKQDGCPWILAVCQCLICFSFSSASKNEQLSLHNVPQVAT